MYRSILITLLMPLSFTAIAAMEAAPSTQVPTLLFEGVAPDSSLFRHAMLMSEVRDQTIDTKVLSARLQQIAYLEPALRMDAL
jgi:hypothetical protein